jgi:HTH-type transcriptional regulator/antitoxin HigA
VEKGLKMLPTQVAETLTQSATFIFVPTKESEYIQLVALLDEITDLVRDDEYHPLAKVMDVIGVLIENYEDEHFPEPEGDPISVLKYLMEAHNLKDADLSELGNQGVVSEILNGKQDLNLRQVKALSKRFNLPVSVFV